MRRHDYTKASLMVSLACMTIFGAYVVSANPQASAIRSPDVERSRIVDESVVTFQCVVSVPGLTGTQYDLSQLVRDQSEIVSVLKQEVMGMKPGEEKTIELTPEEGFGMYDHGKKITVQKTHLPAGVQEGSIVQNAYGDFATVVDIFDASAVLDYNHPLAGKPLVVWLRILTVEPLQSSMHNEDSLLGAL